MSPSSFWNIEETGLGQRIQHQLFCTKAIFANRCHGHPHSDSRVPPTASSPPYHLLMAETHGRPRDSPRPVFFESGRPLCRRWPSPQPGPGHLYVSDTPLRCGPSQAAVIVKCNQESESLDGRLPGEQNTVAGWLEMAVEFDVWKCDGIRTFQPCLRSPSESDSPPQSSVSAAECEFARASSASPRESWRREPAFPTR